MCSVIYTYNMKCRLQRKCSPPSHMVDVIDIIFSTYMNTYFPHMPFKIRQIDEMWLAYLFPAEHNALFYKGLH